MKGCMNCGNISCGNNKKRECAGCGRWISPEDKIAELEEKVGMAERTRDRLKAMGFPTLASCKEYSAKLETLEKENERLTVDYETLKLHDEEEIGMLKSENAELTDELKTLRESMKDYGAGCYENGLRNGRRKLEEQIDKMKCCGNCRFSESDKLNGTFCHREGCYVVASAKCKLWEN